MFVSEWLFARVLCESEKGKQKISEVENIHEISLKRKYMIKHNTIQPKTSKVECY